MMIGLITPPMGQLVFLISGITGIKVAVILGEVWGLLFMLIVAALRAGFRAADHALAADPAG